MLSDRKPTGRNWWSFGKPAMMWPQLVCPLLFYSLGWNVHVSSHVHAKVTSNAIKGWQIIFSRSTKSEHAKTWRLLVCTLWRCYIWKGNRVWIHSFERKLSALSNAVSGKVVRRIGRELFDLKARGDIFFNHPVWCKKALLRRINLYQKIFLLS